MPETAKAPETLTEEQKLTRLLTVTTTSTVNGTRTESLVLIKPINDSPLAREALQSQAASNMALQWALDHGIPSPLLSDLPAIAILDENDNLVANPNQAKYHGRKFKIQRNMLS